MSSQITNRLIGKELLDLLEETFEKAKGIYLDRETSLIESLENLSADEASKSIAEQGTTIAGQVAHVRFYLKVLQDYIDGNKDQKIDWKQSWLVKTVKETEWRQLLEGLRADYQQVCSAWQADRDWTSEDQLGGAMAIIVHTAYHLGSIRQILHIAR